MSNFNLETLSASDDAGWDMALLVYYPSRAAFVDMVTSDEYFAANEHRTNGVDRHLIVATRTLMFEDMPNG